MNPISRRRMLSSLGALPFVGSASGPASAASHDTARAGEADGAALVTERDRKEYARLNRKAVAEATNRKRPWIG